MHTPALPVKKLRTVQLAAIIFLTVSGGPYGLEPLLTYAGHAALLLLVVTPLLWDIPAIFTVLELNSMMPVTGGYYQWVKRALGLRWGLFEGWWTWLYTFVDLAIYPVLFVEYLAFFFPEAAAYKIPVCLVIIWVSAGLNILGIVQVGKASVLLGVIVLLPFLVLFAVMLLRHSGSFSVPPVSMKGMNISSLGMALYTIMWNFIGWDNTTTYAEEVNRPVRSYLVAVSMAFVLICIVYFAAVLTAQVSGIGSAVLLENGFPALGRLVGGPWLGALIAAGGMASALGLYSGVLLSVSRVPQVMADDELLPARLHALHPRFNTPYVSIIICSVVVSAMIFWTFSDLLIIDVTLYGAGLSLEFVSLIVLRIKAPDDPRPFRIPLNVAGLCLMACLPLGIFAIAVAGALSSSEGTLGPVLFALAALLSAEVVWRILISVKPHLKRKR